MKEIKSLRMKLNVHRHKYSPEQITVMENRLQELQSEVSNLQQNQIEMKENPTDAKEVLADIQTNKVEIKQNQTEMKENKDNAKEVLADTQADKVENKENQTEMKENKEIPVFVNDDDYLRSLSAETYKAPEAKEILTNKAETKETETEPAKEDKDFAPELEEKPDEAVAQKVEQIKAQEEQKETKQQETIVDIKEGQNEEAEVRLSPKMSADIIVSVLTAVCKDFLPTLYDWSLYSQEEKDGLKEFHQLRRAFDKAQRKGEIPKTEVFYWEDSMEILLNKQGRIEQYKEDAPLTKDQIDQLKLVWEMYFKVKKVSMTPEAALITGMSTILLQKLGPIGKEKVMDLFAKFDNENEL